MTPTGENQEPPSDEQSLPSYSRSLLKIQTPVMVVLAAKRQPISKILEIGPGSIIQFEKSCEELLDLVVCDQPIAAGEVVKVGDKFGLRIRNMILPQEQFIAIKGTMAS